MAGYVAHDVQQQVLGDGSVILRSALPLGPVAHSTGQWLHDWAAAAPTRVAFGERSGAGWRELGYAELLETVRAIAAALLARGLSGATPIAIISANSLDHALLSLAAQYVGIPTVPLAEQYALIPEAHARLRQAIETVRPAMVFAEDARAYGPALALDCFDGVERVVSDPAQATLPVTPFAELLRGDGAADIDAAHAAVGPDTLAKIMFTSGSTSQPKGVLTTHGMMCVNQTQLADALGLLRARPPRVLDWLPWNHVFGGSHNFNMMLANGGSYYIDHGKPTEAGFAETLRNTRERMGTLAFNVPMGFGRMVAAMREDQALKEAYFRDLELIFYAGASLPLDVWQALEQFAMEIRGAAPMMVCSWGMTETAPSAIIVHEPVGRSGIIGVPLPGVTARLLPNDAGRYELRVKGPNVMKGYFNEPAKSAEAFDDQGYLITGDAVKFVDPADPNRGLAFDGRVSDGFKLLTGTWVRAAQLRLTALGYLAPIAADLVITGQDRAEIGALIFPDRGALHKAGMDVTEDAGALTGEALQASVHAALTAMAEQGAGSSTRIGRALVLAQPASLPLGEITAKGSLNARKVLTLRKDLLDRLYSDGDPAVVKL
ncbi:AMP-binding protein [Actibacterium sp. XHP0104]|uniref:AMP-binding protein n=1 Tax=Actibacterium sp. XHP0104 TaxID=2984335 RepID=UPI0021E851E2|nr:AMP-binding protein [Actibacterium sp. XHP0104]MCV2881463.1 AMP-binding protein [Actibacterium sp. XHP0104]